MAIWQDLVSDHGFPHAYQTVKRDAAIPALCSYFDACHDTFALSPRASDANSGILTAVLRCRTL
jgi:hypothetical protein